MAWGSKPGWGDKDFRTDEQKGRRHQIELDNRREQLNKKFEADHQRREAAKRGK